MILAAILGITLVLAAAAFAYEGQGGEVAETEGETGEAIGATVSDNESFQMPVQPTEPVAPVEQMLVEVEEPIETVEKMPPFDPEAQA